MSTVPSWVRVGTPPAGRRSLVVPAARLEPAPRRILAVKLADLGDALLATPALAAIRATYPDAQLDVLATPTARDVLARSELVDGFVVLEARSANRRRALPTTSAVAAAREIRRRGYDTVFLFHHLTTLAGSLKHAALLAACGAPRRIGMARPGVRRAWFLTHHAPDLGFDTSHEVESGLAVAAAGGAAGGSAELVFHPGYEAERSAAALLADSPPDRSDNTPDAARSPRSPVVALHPGTGAYSSARRWPAKEFAAVAEHARRSGWSVVLVGGPDDDTDLVRRALSWPILDLTGKTDLATLGAVLGMVNAVVANDGGVMHLAAAMNTPVIGVFGPSNPIAWGPWPGGQGSPHRVVSLELPCRPCFYVGHRLGAPDGCATRDCLRWLDARWVIQALDDVMSAQADGCASRAISDPGPDAALRAH